MYISNNYTGITTTVQKSAVTTTITFVHQSHNSSEDNQKIIMDISMYEQIPQVWSSCLDCVSFVHYSPVQCTQETKLQLQQWGLPAICCSGESKGQFENQGAWLVLSDVQYSMQSITFLKIWQK